MSTSSKLVLGFLALMLPFQLQALAETSQGTITSIDLGGPSFQLVPNHGNTEDSNIVKIKTAPGVQYAGVDSFGALQVGDYVEIEALSKSKTGSNVEATRIARRFVAAENVHYAAAMQVTKTTVTTTTSEPVVVQTMPVATTINSTKTVKDGGMTSTESKTTTTY